MFTLTILGRIPTKKNKYRIAKGGGLFKPKDVTDFEKMFAKEVAVQHIGFITGPVGIHITLVHKQPEPDLDGAITTVLDCLQNSGVYQNDKQVTEIEARKLPESPSLSARAIIRILKI